LNCNRLIYLYPENELKILSGFQDFLETKTISIVAEGYLRNPGRNCINAIITSQKLSKRFQMNINVSEDIKNYIRHTSRLSFMKGAVKICKNIAAGKCPINTLMMYKKIRMS